jgi:hypothetical protein
MVPIKWHRTALNWYRNKKKADPKTSPLKFLGEDA